MFQFYIDREFPAAEVASGLPQALVSGGAPSTVSVRPTVQGPSSQSPRQHAPHGVPVALRCGLRYDQLLYYVERRPSLSILEIGVARAANAARLLAFADALGGKAHYCGIDLFGRLTAEQLAQSYCNDAKQPATLAQTLAWLNQVLGPEIASRIKLCEGLSSEVLPILRQRGSQYDLIFIDGGHDYEAVSGDWSVCQHLLRPGGVAVFDDFPNWGVAGAVAEIDRQAWQVRILEHTDIFENHRRDELPSAKRMHLLVEVTARQGRDRQV